MCWLAVSDESFSKLMPIIKVKVVLHKVRITKILALSKSCLKNYGNDRKMQVSEKFLAQKQLILQNSFVK